MGTHVPIRYHLMAYRREQLWLPAGLWGIFFIIAIFFRNEARAGQMTAAFLGVVLPLMAGVLATSALVEDPALELQLAAPRAHWKSLLERLGLLFGIIVAAALSYQVMLALLGIDLSEAGTIFGRQLMWIAPCLTFMGLASLISLGTAQGTVGVMFAGGIWIVQLLLRDWFDINPVGRWFYLFMGYFNPSNPNLLANQIGLIGLAAVFIFISSLLLRREERYI